MTETATLPYELNANFPNLAGANRMERALDIIKNPRAVKKVSKNTFTVKSQAGFSVYTVIFDKNSGFAACNCPDCIAHHGELGWECKHILAVKLHLKMKEDNLKAKKTEGKQVIDWSTYNLAQMSEGEAFKVYLKQLADMVNVLHPVTTRVGRPSMPMNDLVFCSVMKMYSQLSSRRTHSILKDAEEANNIEYLPHYNSVNKFMGREDVTPILRQLVRLSAAPLSQIEHDFAIDASGFRTNQYGDWCGQKHGTKREHTFVKCHISSGVKTNIIADVLVTPQEGEGTSDTANFIELLDGTTGYFDVEQVSADKGYLSSKNYSAASSMGVEPFIMFKKNSQAGGSKAWQDAFKSLIARPDEWLNNYHKRSNVESTFGALKAKFGETLKSKKYVAQVNEVLCKVIAYNITVLIEAVYSDDLDINFGA